MTIRASPRAPARLRNTLLVISCLLTAVLLGWIDINLSPEVALSVFYLVPIVAATWFVHESAGVGVSLLCGGLAAYDTELLSGLLSHNFWVGLWASASRLIFFLIAVLLVGRLRRNMDSIRQLAMTDSLTGVYNARAFFDFLEKEMARSRRYGRPTSLMYLDLDNFKSINDAFGHQVGDTALEVTAGTLKNSVRAADIVARMGGDEFAVLLPETEEATARTIAERAREKLVREMEMKHWPLTFSVGLSSCRDELCTADELLHLADDLMYQVKRSGKNGIRHRELHA